MKDYLINVFFREADECYVANIPDLKYCSAVGDTPEMALRELLRAKKAWLATAKKLGKPVPEPRRSPVSSRHR